MDTAVGARISSQDLAGLVLGSSLAGGIGWVVMQLIGGLPGVLGRLEGAERRQDVARLGGEAVLAAAAIGLLLIVPIAAGLEGLCQFMAERDATSGCRALHRTAPPRSPTYPGLSSARRHSSQRRKKCMDPFVGNLWDSPRQWSL